MKVNSKLNGFGQGTMVLMADGSQKAIEKIKAGDMVLSFDQLNAFAPLEAKRVLDTASRVDRGALEVIVEDTGASLKVAPGQLFINTNQDWHRASTINEIIDRDGNICKFEVKQIKTGKYAIYDIIVEDNHSLIANGVRVHNMLYSQADVVAGRYASAKYDTPGAASSQYGSDYDTDGDTYTHGNSKKKKAKASKKMKSIRNKNTIAYTRPDDLAVASKLLASMSDLTDLTLDIIDAATPSELNTLKLTVQSSVDNIVSYAQSYLSSILNVATSIYDKSELYQWGLDIIQNAAAARKPFEETVVSASGKLNALNLLSVINLNIIRSKAKIQIYTTPDTKGDLDVKVNGKSTKKSKLSALPGKSSKSTKQQNGKYQIQSCFTFDTLISMASGEKAMIGTIKAGDFVIGKDKEINRVVGVEVVTLGSRNLYGFNGMAPFVSEEHPLMTSKGWGAFKVASLKKYEPEVYSEVEKENKLVRIKSGTTLVTEAGEVKITALEKMDVNCPSLKIYNLLLDNNHTYYANGILVHNKASNSGTGRPGGDRPGGGAGSSTRSTGGNSSNNPSGPSKSGPSKTGPSKSAGAAQANTGAGAKSATSCFTAETKIKMSTNEYKSIVDVKVGDSVIGKNNSVNTVLGIEIVTLGSRNLYGFNGMTPFVSEEHPLMTTKGWGAFKVASLKKYEPEVYNLISNENVLVEITEQTILVTENGNVNINDLTIVNEEYSTKLYNLILDNTHTYYANGILVHNKVVS